MHREFNINKGLGAKRAHCRVLVLEFKNKNLTELEPLFVRCHEM
jgi:hypothetical protein